jgi:signal transduction histidine kinase
MARALADGAHRFEWVCRKLDGTDFPVEVTLTTLQLEGRQVMQAVVLDLTERKRAEVELQNALAKERELSELKSDFVSLVSHEFRTPLEVIMSSVDNLDRYHDRLPAEKREQLLRTINRSVRRMALMMEEVLVLGRVESGKMAFKPTDFDLRLLCNRIRDEIQSATGQRCPINLQTDGVPEIARGDENVLRHILSNLLSNAVKYSDANQPVTLSVGRENGAAVFCVTDRGCGIPAADQARLFQAFHRGMNVRHIPGTGLGLLIVKRCVDLHGGDIQFESVEGRGTTFTVRIELFYEKDPRD